MCGAVSVLRKHKLTPIKKLQLHTVPSPNRESIEVPSYKYQGYWRFSLTLKYAKSISSQGKVRKFDKKVCESLVSQRKLDKKMTKLFPKTSTKTTDSRYLLLQLIHH